jgi:hypothetical protein
MKKVFFVRRDGGKPYMLVTVQPGGTEFQPISDDADDVSDVLESVFKNKPITKRQLDDALDQDFAIEGPVAVTRDTNKKIKEFANTDVPSLKSMDFSAIKISDLGVSNTKDLVNFKARSFLYDQTKTTFNYEVKRVRAIWDPSLSIPGTGRRGGWRCPVGTRYGGQITDRFGRNCGWGVARRIANAITNIGERLESVDDRRRGRRAEQRNQRVMRRLQRDARGGAAERGLRAVADVLDGEDTASPTPEAPAARTPKAPAKPRGRRRVFDSDVRDAGLRDSELRRVRREIEEPGAPRTGVIDLDDTIELPAGESTPDSRSFRNVNNRFPKNGLPDEAYWRRDSYTGDDKAELERRFGRYYDDKNKINQRGKFVNQRLDDFRKRQAAPKKKPEPRKQPRGKRKPSQRPKGVVEGPLDGESFNDYVDRKYDEYKNRVEKIQRDGGRAGLLTKKEWFDVNQGNLRSAWDKKNPDKKRREPRKKPAGRAKPPVADKEPTPKRPRKISKKDVFDNSIQAVSYEGAAKKIDDLPDNWLGDGPNRFANAEGMRDSLRRLAARLAKYDKDDRVELENGEDIRVEDLAKNVLDAADAWDRFAKRAGNDDDERARRAEVADILENQRANNRPAQPDTRERIEQLIDEEAEIERQLERNNLANFGADAKDWTEAHDGMMKQIGLRNDEVRNEDDQAFKDNWNAEDAEQRNQFEEEMAQLDMGNMDAAELEERINLRDEQIKQALEQLEKDLKLVEKLRKPQNPEEFAERKRAFERIAANERRVNLNKQFNKENRGILEGMRDNGGTTQSPPRGAKKPKNSDIKRVVKFEEIDENEGISVGDAIAHIGFRDEDDRVIDALAEKFGIPTRDTQRQRESNVGRVNMADVGEAIRERIERNKKERWNPNEKKEFAEKLADQDDDVLDRTEEDADRAVDQAADKVRTALEDLARIRRKIKERKGSLKRLKKEDKQDLQREADRLIVWNAILLEKRARLKMVQDELQKRQGRGGVAENDAKAFDDVVKEVNGMVSRTDDKLSDSQVAELKNIFEEYRNQAGPIKRNVDARIEFDRLVNEGQIDPQIDELIQGRRDKLDEAQRKRNVARQNMDRGLGNGKVSEKMDEIREYVKAQRNVRQIEEELDRFEKRKNVIKQQKKRIPSDYKLFVDEGGMELNDVTSEMLRGGADRGAVEQDWFRKQVEDGIAKQVLDEGNDFEGGAVYRLPNGSYVFISDKQRTRMRQMEERERLPKNQRAERIIIIDKKYAPDRPANARPQMQKALGTEDRGPVGNAFPRRRNEMGEFGIKFSEKGIGEYVPVNNPEIRTKEDAIKWVANGESLDEVPHEFWHDAIEANSSTAKRDKSKRFRQLARNGGAVGDTRIYVLRDKSGYGTNHGIVLKAAQPGDNIGEVVGWNYLDRLGIIDGGAVYDGESEGGQRYVMFNFAFKDIPEGNEIDMREGVENFAVGDAEADPYQALPGRVTHWLANYMLGVSDRHPWNGFLKRVKNDGQDKVHIVPIDLGWAGRAVLDDPIQFVEFGYLGLDSGILDDMQRLYASATPENKQRILRDLTRAVDNVIEKTENMLDVDLDVFVAQAIKNVPEKERRSAQNKSERLYNQMKGLLDTLKRRRQAIIDKVTR